MAGEGTGRICFPDRKIDGKVKRAGTAVVHIPSKIASDLSFGFEQRDRVQITLVEPGKLLIEKINESTS
jgi:hypothetical protein